MATVTGPTLTGNAIAHAASPNRGTPGSAADLSRRCQAIALSSRSYTRLKSTVRGCATPGFSPPSPSQVPAAFLERTQHRVAHYSGDSVNAGSVSPGESWPLQQVTIVGRRAPPPAFSPRRRFARSIAVSGGQTCLPVGRSLPTQLHQLPTRTRIELQRRVLLARPKLLSGSFSTGATDSQGFFAGDRCRGVISGNFVR